MRIEKSMVGFEPIIKISLPTDQQMTGMEAVLHGKVVSKLHSSRDHPMELRSRDGTELESA